MRGLSYGLCPVMLLLYRKIFLISSRFRLITVENFGWFTIFNSDDSRRSFDDNTENIEDKLSTFSSVIISFCLSGKQRNSSIVYFRNTPDTFPRGVLTIIAISGKSEFRTKNKQKSFKCFSFYLIMRSLMIECVKIYYIDIILSIE